MTAADAELAAAGRRGIADLNARYGRGRRRATRFLWLQRSRHWNPAQQRWMGWERKRGKLARTEPPAARRARHHASSSSAEQYAALPAERALRAGAGR